MNTATEYNNALLVIENSSIGWAAIQQVIDREYENLFYMSKDLQYVDTQKQMTNKIYRQEKQMVPLPFLGVHLDYNISGNYSIYLDTNYFKYNQAKTNQ